MSNTGDENVITISQIVAEFKKYNPAHPLKIMSDAIYDNIGGIIKENFVKCVWALNSINAIGRALITLSRFSIVAYNDMIRIKLKAKDGKGYNQHNLISAFCELSLMNTFLVRSTDPDSFKYEDRCVGDSNKNVEFSIIMDDFRFHVEVKTSNLLQEDRNIAKLLKNNEEVLILDSRSEYFGEIKSKSRIPVIGSLENRMVDYLESANSKFASSVNEHEVNLLVICWDDRIYQPLMALKRVSAEGILTDKSFLRNDDGTPKLFDNIDCILLNSGYQLFKEYIGFLLYDRFSPLFPVDPFYQLFSYNFLIDNNLTTDRINIIQSIIQQKVKIVDEKYAETLSPMRIAFIKDVNLNVISFREIDMSEILEKYYVISPDIKT